MAAQNPKLSSRMRDRQDLVRRYFLTLRNLTTAESLQPNNEKILAGMKRKIREIDQELNSKFPEYCGYVTPQALSVEEAESLLAENEALVLFFDSFEMADIPEESLKCSVGVEGCEFRGESEANIRAL